MTTGWDSVAMEVNLARRVDVFNFQTLLLISLLEMMERDALIPLEL